MSCITNTIKGDVLCGLDGSAPLGFPWDMIDTWNLLQNRLLNTYNITIHPGDCICVMGYNAQIGQHSLNAPNGSITVACSDVRLSHLFSRCHV